MRKAVGYLLFGLGILILWPLQIGLFAFGIYYIVKIFLEHGVLPGIISIPITLIALTIIHFILAALVIPLAGLTDFLLEERDIAEVYKKEWEGAKPEARPDLEWRYRYWQKLMEDGLNSKEADRMARKLSSNPETIQQQIETWQRQGEEHRAKAGRYQKLAEERFDGEKYRSSARYTNLSAEHEVKAESCFALVGQLRTTLTCLTNKHKAAP